MAPLRGCSSAAAFLLPEYDAVSHVHALDHAFSSARNALPSQLLDLGLSDSSSTEKS